MLKSFILFFAILLFSSVHAQSDCVDLCTGNVDPILGEFTICWACDFNCDARVDVLDLPFQLAYSGCTVDENSPSYHQLLRADNNDDGIVSVSDLLNFLNLFGTAYE